MDSDRERRRRELETIRDAVAVERSRARLRVTEYDAVITEYRARQEVLRRQVEIHTFDLGMLEADLRRTE